MLRRYDKERGKRGMRKLIERDVMFEGVKEGEGKRWKRGGKRE